MNNQETARQRIAECESRKADAERAMRQIDEGKITFHEAGPGESLRDVTQMRRDEILGEIEALNELIWFWKRDLGG